MVCDILALLLCRTISGGAQISVSLCDMANLRLSTVTVAKRDVEHVFAAAQVRVKWRGCLVSNAQDDATFEIRLRADPSLRTRKLATFRIMGGAILGAEDRGPVAEAYWPGVKDTARLMRTDPGELLGYVIAHEIGHLIIGDGHSPEGLMRDSWGKAEIRELSRGWLGFSARDRKRIQSALHALQESM